MAAMASPFTPFAFKISFGDMVSFLGDLGGCAKSSKPYRQKAVSRFRPKEAGFLLLEHEKSTVRAQGAF